MRAGCPGDVPCAPCDPCRVRMADDKDGGDEPRATTAAKGLMPWPMDRALALLTELRLMLPRVYRSGEKGGGVEYDVKCVRGGRFLRPRRLHPP